jgi:hypothetical protein
MRDDIEPMVPVMPRQTSTERVRADGGRTEHYDTAELTAPLVPEI